MATEYHGKQVATLSGVRQSTINNV